MASWVGQVERWRWVMVLAAVLGLVGLGHRYSLGVQSVPDGIRACLEVPEANDGRRVVLPVWIVTQVDGPERYQVSRVLKGVQVEGDARGLEPGQVITLVGHFRAADRTVVELRREIHHRRIYKQALSLLGLLLAMGAAPWFFTVRAGYLRLRGVQPDA